MSTPDPFAGVPGPLRNALCNRGFESLTEVQRAVVAADAEGRDLRISSKTGSGKTVAIGFALASCLLGPRKPDATPANAADGTVPGEPTSGPTPSPQTSSPQTSSPHTGAEQTAERGGASRAPGPDTPRASSAGKRAHSPLALIITPTRELATQVRDELRWLYADVAGTRVEVVTGGTDVGGERRMLRRPPTILVGTPGRLLDHLRSEALSCGLVEHVVLDEADRMLEMGFRDELEAIIDTLPKARRSHLVSATFSGAIRRVADRFQGSNALHLEGTALGEANTDIEHVAQVVHHEERYPALVNALLLSLGEQVLVFVDRRAGATELAEELAGDGFAALPFSGELSQAQRTRTLHAFRTGTIQVLVSTDVAARGIDVPSISMVVHMSPPQDPDAYTHRSGRTGRAGRRGRSLLLVPPRAQRYVARLLVSAKIEAEWQPAPGPAKVRKALTKRTRKQLHGLLDAEAGPSEKTLAYAAHLLEEREPTALIATLLEMAEPHLPREPMPVESIPPMAEAERVSGGYGGGHNDGRRGPPRGRRPHRGAPRGPSRGGPRGASNGPGDRPA